ASFKRSPHDLNARGLQSLTSCRGRPSAEWISLMNTRIPCIRCGKPVQSVAVLAGTAPICSDCSKYPVLRVDDPERGRMPLSGARSRAWPIEKSLTRSMVLPIPGSIALAPGEMICRLEPVTLIFRELSPELRAYIGKPPDELLHQSVLQYVHQDD